MATFFSMVQMLGGPQRMQKCPHWLEFFMYGALGLHRLQICSCQDKIEFPNLFCCHLHWFQGSRSKYSLPHMLPDLVVLGWVPLTCNYYDDFGCPLRRNYWGQRIVGYGRRRRTQLFYCQYVNLLNLFLWELLKMKSSVVFWGVEYALQNNITAIHFLTQVIFIVVNLVSRQNLIIAMK